MVREPVSSMVEAVDADSLPSGRRHPVAEGANVIFIHLVRFLVAFFAHGDLHLEPPALLLRIVQLGIGVADLHAAGEDLEALHHLGFVGFVLGKRRGLDRKIVDDGRLNEL